MPLVVNEEGVVDGLTQDQTVREHAGRILGNPVLGGIRGETADRVQRVVDAVFNDEKITAEFQGAIIRCTAMRGNVARAILHTVGESPDNIIQLSIGDVTLPEFARETITQIFRRAHELHMESIKGGETGYDVAAKGSETARRSFITYLDEYYDFSAVAGLQDKLSINCCVANGGMEALHYIAESLACDAITNGKQYISVQPDNSFSTWFSIAKRATRDDPNANITLPTKQENLLHLAQEDIDEFYNRHGISKITAHSWYITPVGNPSGTAMKPDQLANVCDAIVVNDPSAVIILDCVYIRTMDPERAREILAGVIGNPEVRERVIFVESFSKTHGVCGERVGAFFSANPKLFNPPMNVVMQDTAGMPRFTDAQIRAFSTATPEQNAVIKQLHKFWAAERHGLYNHLIRNGNYTDLFHENQSHIIPADIEHPTGLYILPRLKPGVDQKKVLLRTKGLGVETKMGSGDYMRFSVGKLTVPTYSDA